MQLLASRMDLHGRLSLHGPFGIGTTWQKTISTLIDEDTTFMNAVQKAVAKEVPIRFGPAAKKFQTKRHGTWQIC